MDKRSVPSVPSCDLPRGDFDVNEMLESAMGAILPDVRLDEATSDAAREPFDFCDVHFALLDKRDALLRAETPHRASVAAVHQPGVGTDF
jgi:hypothetical protein